MPPLQTFQRTAPGAQQNYQQAQTTAQQAQQRLRQFQSAGPRQTPTTTSLGGTYNRSDPNWGRQQTELWNQSNQARQQAEQARQGVAQSLAADNRNEGYGIIRDRVNQMNNDPTDQFIRQRLREAAGPGGGPFDATTRNAMFTAQAQAGGAQAANAAQQIMQQAAERGMSADDPGVRAALARVQSQQGAQAQQARLGIDLAANPANYAAQQSAVDRLGRYSQTQTQAQLSAEDRLRQMLMNEQFQSGPGTPDYSSYIRS